MTIHEIFHLEKLGIAQFVKIFPLENILLYGNVVDEEKFRISGKECNKLRREFANVCVGSF